MYDFHAMKDDELLSKTDHLIGTERQGHAAFLAALSEVDARKLYLPQGYSSLFTFCTKRFRLSESSAAKRIQVARLAARFPVILEHIARNEITMTNASVLSPHLTAGNHLVLIKEALGKGKVEVEKIVATHFPKPDIEESIRKLPSPRTFAGEGKLPLAPAPPLPVAPTPTPTRRPERVEPLSARRTKFEFSGDDALVAMYKTLQDRLRRKYPKGRMEDLVREAFELLLERTDPTREPKHQVTKTPSRRHTRRPSKSVCRQVWKRDRSRCTFVSADQTQGRAPGVSRCDATAFLELDHVIPWSLGGSSRTPDDFTLRCRAHNAWRGGAKPPDSPPPADCGLAFSRGEEQARSPELVELGGLTVVECQHWEKQNQATETSPLSGRDHRETRDNQAKMQ